MARVEALEFPVALADRLGRARDGGVSIYWLGQAGFAITGNGRMIVVDPYLSDSLAAKYRGTQFPHERMMPPPIAPGGFPRIDCVLVTHRHTDHMDPGTLSPIARLFPECRFVVPRAACEEAAKRIGVTQDRLVPMNAGEHAEPLPGLRVSAVRAAHETLERDAGGNYRFLGYVVEMEGLRLYHSGDTVPFAGQVEEVKALEPDVALLPVNGRRPDLAAAGIAGNLSVAEAIDLAAATGAGAAIFHHYGMFAFNTADPRAVDRAMAAAAHNGCETKLLRAQTGREYRISQS